MWINSAFQVFSNEVVNVMSVNNVLFCSDSVRLGESDLIELGWVAIQMANYSPLNSCLLPHLLILTTVMLAKGCNSKFGLD